MSTDNFIPIAEKSNNHLQSRIRPDDLPETLLSSFGKSEVETTAGRLVAFFKHRGYWSTFTIDELTRFYQSKGWNPNTMFAGLAGGWFDDGFYTYRAVSETLLWFGFDGTCGVTNHFIERCARSMKHAAA